MKPFLRFMGLIIAAGFLAGMGRTDAASAVADSALLPPAATRPVDFEKDIQPIFANQCHSCHGAKKQESAFRLDRKASAFKGGELFEGRAIVPGKSAESVLLFAVAQVHPDLKMPKKGDRLTTEQVGLIRAWIEQGAPWPEPTASASARNPADHWAFKAPVRPTIPDVRDKKWVRTPVDNFILAKLAADQLKPSPEADKITLLRRLHLDLTGLPPTVAEVDAFLADKSADAYEKAVEKLLASPHYGERWGRHWLDAARYADSDGYEKDMSREMWPYRDYVVSAFNRDLPYDQFVIEQFAGDMLPNATQDQFVATGYLRNSMLNQEGAIDPEQFRMDAMFDRLESVGKGVLGLTIQCAQCHNHKYDPLSQEEYYRLFAFLNNDHEARPVVYPPDQQMKIAGLHRQIGEIEKDLQHRMPDWEDRMAAWESQVRSNQPDWTVIRDLHYEGDRAQRYEFLPDGSLLACGYAPTKMTQWWRTTNDLSGLTAFRIELFNDPSLPFGGPGRAFNGTCALTEFFVEASELNSTNKAKAKWNRATADYNQPKRQLEDNYYDKTTNSRFTGPIEFAIDGDGNTGWGINAGPGRRNQERKAVFVADKPIGFGSNTYWRIGVQQNLGGWNSDDHMNNNLGRYRISATTATGPVTADPLPKKVCDIITNTPREKRSRAQQATVFSYWRTTVAGWKEANAQIEKLRDDWPEGATSLTLLAGKHRETSILRRGDWLKPTKTVDGGTPAFLHPLAADGKDSRLAFARWLVDRKSPTTARVFVNRVWQAYFGIGMVSTPEDFGMQADNPSHPELLDWLAVEFMEPRERRLGLAGNQPDAALLPWSIKHIHRLIVNSATYRQSSKVTAALEARDPYNRLLARGSRIRVEGEIVRDIALSVSGLLNPKIGGRSVMPMAPEYLFQPPASYAPFPWKNEVGAENYRRALYTFRRRSTPYPVLQTFDVPNADFSCVRRQRSNSPLQALVSLNEPIFVECAQSLARKILQEGGSTDESRVSYGFRRVLSRPPEPGERRELLNLLERERQRFAEGWLNPNEVAGRTESTKALFPKPPADGKSTGAVNAETKLAATSTPAPTPTPTSTPTQLAAYTVLSRVLLNLDEAITKE